MAGSALTVGVVAGCAVLVSSLAAVGAAAAESQRVAGAADAAALAAADTALGVVPGEPCAQAGVVADAAGVSVTGCVVDGQVVTVTVAGTFAALPVTATARAGPSPVEQPASGALSTPDRSQWKWIA